MKITTFNNSNNSKKYTFHTNHTEETNYSKILDNLISSNIKKNNAYLNNYSYDEDTLIDGMLFEAKLTDAINIGKALKGNNLIAAAKFLASYGTKKYNKLPYQFGHIYYFNNMPIIFHFDSIEINGKEFYYDDFNNIDILNLSDTNKKLIIDIYTNSNTTININL